MGVHKFLLAVVIAMAVVIVVLLGAVGWGFATKSRDADLKSLFAEPAAEASREPGK